MGKYGQGQSRRPVPNPFHDLQFLQCFGALSIGFAFILAILYILEKNKKKRLEDQLGLEKRNNKTDHKKSKESIKTYRTSIGSLERELDKVKEINRKLDSQLVEKLQELDKKGEENKQLLSDRMDRDFILHEAGLRFQSFPEELLKTVQCESKHFIGNMANILNKIEIWKKLVAIYLDQEISVSFRVRYFNLIVDLENLEKKREVKNFEFQQLRQNTINASAFCSPESGAGDHDENFKGVAEDKNQIEKILEEIQELDKLQNSKMNQLSFLQAQLENQHGTGNLSLSSNNSNFFPESTENSFPSKNNYGDFPIVKNVSTNSNSKPALINNNNIGKTATLPRKASKPVPSSASASVPLSMPMAKVKRSNSLSLPWQILQKNTSKREAGAINRKPKLNNSVDDRLLFELNMSGQSGNQSQDQDEFEQSSNISLGLDQDQDVDAESSILSQGDGDVSTKGVLKRRTKPKIPAFITKILNKRKNFYAFPKQKSAFDKCSDSGSGSTLAFGYETEESIPIESNVKLNASGSEFQDEGKIDYETALKSLNLELLSSFESRSRYENQTPDFFHQYQPHEKILQKTLNQEEKDTDKTEDENEIKDNPSLVLQEAKDAGDHDDETEEICGQPVKNLVYVSLHN